MPEFAYVARNLKGEKVSGRVSASSEREALSSLSTQSLFSLQVKAEAVAGSGKSSRRVKGQVMSAVYSQLSALLRSGVPLLRSIAVLRDQTTNATLKFVLDEIYSKVED